MKTTLVLVHGAGHTSAVWGEVQAHLAHASVAVDLPGRGSRPADITSVTIDAAADSAAADLDGEVEGPIVLVGHSAGGIVLPALAARLDRRVVHLVFVAGLCARHGAAVADTLRPGARTEMAARLVVMRREFADHVFVDPVLPDPVFAQGRADPNARVIHDPRTAMGIDSLNFITQTVSWDGVDAALPRTFVCCTRDPIQSPELQARLIENCAATSVVGLDSGHTPALDVPEELAGLLDGIASAATSP